MTCHRTAAHVIHVLEAAKWQGFDLDVRMRKER